MPPLVLWVLGMLTPLLPTDATQRPPQGLHGALHTTAPSSCPSHPAESGQDQLQATAASKQEMLFLLGEDFRAQFNHHQNKIRPFGAEDATRIRVTW